MELPAPLAAEAAGFCRSAAITGVAGGVQVALLTVTAGIVGRAVRALGPTAQSLVYRLALVGTCLVLLLDLCGVAPLPSLWRLSLPPAVVERAAPVNTPGQPAYDSSIAPEADRPTGSFARGSRGARAEHALDVPSPTVASLAEPVVPAPSVALAHAAPSDASRIEARVAPVEQRVASAPGGPVACAYLAIALLYALGLLTALAWLAASAIGLRRLCALGTPCVSGCAAETLDALCGTLEIHAPGLCLHPTAPTPFLTGIVRPTIFLPAALERDIDSVALRAILAHELTHLRRRDCTWRLLARAVTVVLWFHPLTWLLRRWMDEADEGACDQAAVDLGCPAVTYAGCLVRLAETYAPSGMPRATEAHIAAFRSTLGRRVERILRASGRTRPVGLRTRAALGLGGLVSLLAALAVVSGARPAVKPSDAGPQSSARASSVTAPGRLTAVNVSEAKPVAPSASLSAIPPLGAIEAYGQLARNNSARPVAEHRDFELPEGGEMKLLSKAPAVLGALIGIAAPAPTPAQQAATPQAAQPAAAAVPSQYQDVAPTHWAYPTMAFLQQKEIVRGFPDGYFNGKRTLIRIEFAVALKRALYYVEKIGPRNEPILQGPPGVTHDEVDALRKLTIEFTDELQALGVNMKDTTNRLNALAREIDALKARLNQPIGFTLISVPKQEFDRIGPWQTSPPLVVDWPNVRTRPIGSFFVGESAVYNLSPLLQGAVQSELRMTDGQIRQVKAVDDRASGLLTRGHEAEATERGAKTQARTDDDIARREYDDIDLILRPAQFDRWKQICLQEKGLWALRDRQVADEIGLAEAQRVAIESKHSAFADTFGRWTTAAGKTAPLSPEDRAEVYAANGQGYRAVERAVLAELTPAQRARLRLMIGRTFNWTSRPYEYYRFDDYWQADRRN